MVLGHKKYCQKKDSVVLPRDMKTKREESEEIMEQTILPNAMRSCWEYDGRLNKSDHAK